MRLPGLTLRVNVARRRARMVSSTKDSAPGGQIRSLADCSTKCAACQVKFWLWEWDPWALEFKDTTGHVWKSAAMPPDFHVVSGRCDCNRNDPASVPSKNGKRPLEAPQTPSSWRVKTGDAWTENAPTNRPLYYSVTPAQIAATPGMSASDLYLGSSIASGVDMVTGADVLAAGRYLKCFFNITDKDLPEGVLYAQPGEFMICRSAQAYKVFRVRGLYVVSRLLPMESALGGATGPDFVLHFAVAASAEPELRYLVEEFEKEFPNDKAAIEAIS